MTRSPFRLLLLIGPFLAGVSLFAGAQTATKTDSDYRTVARAITTKPTTDTPGGAGQTGYLGVSVIRDAQGHLVVEDVSTDSPGAKAGLKTGDRITRIGDRAVTSPQAFREWLQTYSPGATVKLAVLRADQTVELTATLTATSRPMTLAKGGGKGGKGGGKGGKGGFKGGITLPLWTKPVLRLAVVCIEFADVKHNAKVADKDWEEAFFSKGAYANKKSATDQTVHGSLNDYFLEQSAGVFHLEGKVFDWVNVGKKRGDYIQGTGTSNKNVVLNDALAVLEARDGKDALKDFDILLFLYAGERYQTNPGAVYFPHVGNVFEGEKRWPYLLTAEGGGRMASINNFTKLVGQVMGLPDLAARREDAGSLGLGVWCALSNPITDGRPQHFCAWAKEKIGWIQPAIIDPTVKQKLLLAPNRGFAEGVLQDPRSSQWQRVLPVGEPPQEGLRCRPACRRAANLARAQ